VEHGRTLRIAYGPAGQSFLNLRVSDHDMEQLAGFMDSLTRHIPAPAKMPPERPGGPAAGSGDGLGDRGPESSTARGGSDHTKLEQTGGNFPPPVKNKALYPAPIAHASVQHAKIPRP
jgi:hypothetical protein